MHHVASALLVYRNSHHRITNKLNRKELEAFRTASQPPNAIRTDVRSRNLRRRGDRGWRHTGDDQKLVAVSLLGAFVTYSEVSLFPDGPHSATTDMERDIEQDETHHDRDVERYNDARQHG